MDENTKVPAKLEPQRPKKPPTHTRINRQGLLEIIDLTTGAILCVQRQPGDDFLQGKFDNLIEIKTPQGPVWIERSIDPSKINLAPKMPYSLAWADLLAEQMVEGSSLSKACQSVDIPYSLVCRWRREFPEFRTILDDARKDRAESLHDEVVDTARAQPLGDKHAKIHIEALKWAAEKGDPDKFGTRTKIVGDQNAPIAFVIDTGIRRKGDQGFVGAPLPAHVGEDGTDPILQGQVQADMQSNVIDVTEPPDDFENFQNFEGKNVQNQEPVEAGHEVESLDEALFTPDIEQVRDLRSPDRDNEGSKR